jgi:hypothetical protein
MRFESTKNYLTPEECAQLNGVTQYGYDNGQMTLGVRTTLRYTSRIDPELYTYPQGVFDLATRVRAYCGVANYPVINNQGATGIVTNYMPTNADIFPYQAWQNPTDNAAQFWAFIVTQAPESGGVLQINGYEYPVEAGELFCYLTSEVRQYTTPVFGPTTRICWMFGNWVPAQDWENGTIIYGGA